MAFAAIPNPNLVMPRWMVRDAMGRPWKVEFTCTTRWGWLGRNTLVFVAGTLMGSEATIHPTSQGYMVFRNRSIVHRDGSIQVMQKDERPWWWLNNTFVTAEEWNGSVRRATR